MTQPVPPDDVTQPPEPVVDETLTPLEAAFYTLVLAALTSWLGSVANRILAPFRRLGQPVNPVALWAEQPKWDAEVKVMVNWLRDNAAPHGWDRFAEDNPTIDLGPLPSNDAFVAVHLAQVANHLVRIPEEVFDQVIAAVVDGHNEGENLEQIAERIEGILTVTGSENWPARARVISVTETNGAANSGWLAAAIHSEELTGQRLDKEWLASHDDRVRIAPDGGHLAADGQRRPLRQPFLVGGEPLMYPGDKSGSAWNVINCRCAATTTEAR
jgi:hypothetical protein